MKVIIKGQPWKVKLLSTDKYSKQFGRDSMALTDKLGRTMYFDRDVLTVGTCRHEIGHSIAWECNVESSSLNAHQMEELFCSILDSEFESIDKVSKQIMKNANRCKKAKK